MSISEAIMDSPGDYIIYTWRLNKGRLSKCLLIIRRRLMHIAEAIIITLGDYIIHTWRIMDDYTGDSD